VLFNPLIEHAIELSAQWHDRTYRKSRWRDPAFEVPPEEVLHVPVMAHVTVVALTVQRAGWDDATVAAAFVHDVVEDANRFGGAMRLERLVTLLGEAVAARVVEVTEQKYDEAGQPRPWRARKEGYVAQLRRGTPEAMAISLADKLHNLWTINEAIQRGVDVFTPGEGRKALGAPPVEQRWFYEAVFSASLAHSDPRLVPIREAYGREIARFRQRTGQGDGA
jgi:(p)ppGpp synthase/HD superfamily hydrolase